MWWFLIRLLKTLNFLFDLTAIYFKANQPKYKQINNLSYLYAFPQWDFWSIYCNAFWCCRENLFTFCFSYNRRRTKNCHIVRVNYKPHGSSSEKHQIIIISIGSINGGRGEMLRVFQDRPLRKPKQSASNSNQQHQFNYICGGFSAIFREGHKTRCLLKERQA